MGLKLRRFVSYKSIVFWTALILAAVLIFGAANLNAFLAVNKPVGRGVLVVEAWIPTRSLAEAARIFNSGHYRWLVAVGGPVGGAEPSSDEPQTYPELAAQRLDKLGFDTSKLVRISVPVEPAGYRTLSSAAAVAQWANRPGNVTCCVDVFTLGTHARKSWVFFRHALGDHCRVGIIAGSESPAAQNRSWRYFIHSARYHLPNLVGYVYAKLWVFVHPNVVTLPAYCVREMTQAGREARGGALSPEGLP
jgi:hypothetical protein